MPLDIQKTSKKKDISFFALVGGIFCTALVTVSCLIFFIGYKTALEVIENDISREQLTTQTLVQFALQSKWDNINHFTNLITENSNITQYIQQKKYDMLKHSIEELYYNSEDENLAGLIVDIPHTNDTIFIGSTDYNYQSIIHTLLNIKSLSFSKYIGLTDDKLLFFATKKEIILSSTGRVLGNIYSFSVINQNISWLENILHKTHAKAISIIGNGQFLSQHTMDNQFLFHNKELTEHGIIDTPLTLTQPSSSHVFIRLYKTIDPIHNLRSNYTKKLAIIFSFSLIISIFSTFLLYTFLGKGVKNLLNFAALVRQRDPNIRFERSKIKELNMIGETLQEVVKKMAQNEERFISFAENGADWFWEVDADLHFTFIAGKMEEIIDVKEKDIIGRSRAEIYGYNETTSDLDELTQIQKKQQQFRNFHTVWIKKNGEKRHISLSGTPFFSRDNIFLGYRGVGRDITETQQVREELVRALDKATKANEAKSHFLATVSHEFRTPLNAILGFSEVIKDELFGPLSNNIYRDYANDVHVSGRLLLDLINDILDISSIESGKRVFKFENFNLEHVIETCIHQVTRNAKSKNIIINYTNEHKKTDCLGDQRSILQIISNLLSNAVKYTPEDGKINISVNHRDQCVFIQVSDNGIGIPESLLPHITAPFIQANQDAYNAMEGTGLGLSIVKSLTEIHKGNISIESKEGQGTTITVCIPQT